MIWENGIETHKLSYVKRIARPGSMKDTGSLELVHDPGFNYLNKSLFITKRIKILWAWATILLMNMPNTKKERTTKLCCWLVAKSCPTLLRPNGLCSPPGSSVHGISQAKILMWVAISFSRGSSLPRDQT